MEFARITREHERKREQGMPFYGDPWHRWVPYLSERSWGTVREDYNTHYMAQSRAYRWNEDGLAGISDDKGSMCFAVALWNGRDPILSASLHFKEKRYGTRGNVPARQT